MQMSEAWYQQYAVDNGKQDQLAEADAEAARTVANDREAERRMWIRQFEDAKNDVGKLGEETNYMNMWTAARNLGGDYAKEFEGVEKPASMARWDSLGSAATSSSVGGSTSPLATVEVRSYGGDGNYTGSVMVSPFWAGIINMTSSPR
jgi:hypothetical protein